MSARLRVVLAATDHGVRDQQSSVPTSAADDFTDTRPLKWTDLVPSWPDDVDLDGDDTAAPSAPNPPDPLASPIGLGGQIGSLAGSGEVTTRLASHADEGRSEASEWESLESGSLLVEALERYPAFARETPPPAAPDAVPADQNDPGCTSAEAFGQRAFESSHPNAPALPESGSDLAPTPAQPVARLGRAQVPPKPVRGMPQWDYQDSDDETLAGPAPALSGAGAFDVGRRGQKAAKTEGGGRLIAFDPGRRGVKALAVVAAVVVLIAAFLAWRARPRVDPVAAPPIEVAATAGRGDGSAVAQPPVARPGSSGGTEVVVAVGGKVRRPGLVRLPPGSRVADALQAAGGPTGGTDVAMLNLARKVVDGELIMVGVTPPPGAAAPNAPAGAAAGAPINLNTATLADLDRLPGVGPVLAQRIVDARDAQGGFKAVSDLRKVDGIGNARYEQLKDLVIV